MLSLSHNCLSLKRKKVSSLTHFLKRVSFFSSFKFRGSMTLEGCIVIPIFLFFSATLLYGIVIVRFQSTVWEELHETGNNICFMAGKNVEAKEEKIDEMGNVKLSVTYSLKEFIAWLPMGNLRFTDSFFGHAWVGYIKDKNAMQGEETEIYVYVTKTGTKYHLSEECTYLKVQINMADMTEIEFLRNASGEKYKECDMCRMENVKWIYFTKWGNRYHSNSSCTALRRTIYIIALSQVGNRTPCSKCC